MGISSIANKTIVHAAWRTLFDRTRAAARISATIPANAATRRDAPRRQYGIALHSDGMPLFLSQGICALYQWLE
jgi:hypothetical protein